jgi:menaquinone-9 beta-reductase
MKTENRIFCDVVIIGAGPAGCAAALTLAGAGLKVVMLEKEFFPRDKVCGDAIPSKALTTLHAIDPSYSAAFKSFDKKYVTKHSKLLYKKYSLTFDWVLDAYTCTRMEFDNFLFSFVCRHTDTEVRCNTQPVSVLRVSDGMVVTTTRNEVLHTKMVIGADGAHSFTAKQLAPRAMSRDHYVGSVRAYFTDLPGLDTDTVELYFDRKYLPSYLWIFPVHGGRVNIGFGMLSSGIAKKRINLRSAFYEFIDRVPALRQKMGGAVQEGSLEGFGLPLGSNVGTLSGNNFMLAGDAASLVDPITGDGIGNAMLSGMLAGLQAIRSFRQSDFSAENMKGYDRQLMQRLRAELGIHYRAQQILTHVPFLLDCVFIAGRNRLLKQAIKKLL